MANKQFNIGTSTSKIDVNVSGDLNIDGNEVFSTVDNKISTAIANKADKGTTLSDYSIANAYTKTEVDNQMTTKLSKTDVVNNLTTTESGKALDARQGKILDDTITSTVTTLQNYSDDNLDLAKEYTDIEIEKYETNQAPVYTGLRADIDKNTNALAALGTASQENIEYFTNDAQSKANTAESNAKAYADEIKNGLLNGAGTAYDTLKELGDLIDENTDAIDALEQLTQTHISYVNEQDLTTDEQMLARQNQGLYRDNLNLLTTVNDITYRQDGIFRIPAVVTLPSTVSSNDNFSATFIFTKVDNNNVQYVFEGDCVVLDSSRTFNFHGMCTSESDIQQLSGTTTTNWVVGDPFVMIEYGLYRLDIYKFSITYVEDKYIPSSIARTSDVVLKSDIIAIDHGGTGATTAAGALANLGLTATTTELNYCDGVRSNIQEQLDQSSIVQELTQAEYDALGDEKLTNGVSYYITDGDSSSISASMIEYNNGTSGLSATNIQDAIDETNNTLNNLSQNSLTDTSNTYTAIMQDDGNFVIYNKSDSSVIWATSMFNETIPTLLWSNSNMSSQFAAQTIALDLSSYTYVEIEFSHYANESSHFQKTRIGYKNFCTIIEASGTQLWQETRSYTPSSTGITFSAGYKISTTAIANGTWTQSDDRCIPRKIWGIKGE